MNAAFIEEVFVSPIRSVLIIDDEFPTIDSLLESSADRSNYWQTCPDVVKDNAKDLLNFTHYCREPGRGWLVDVHDGQNIDIEEEVPLAQHLRERDLLVLDYHIDGDQKEPIKAKEILKKLAKSENFNLVVVYSKDEPKKIFDEIVLDFLPNFFNLGLEAESIESIESALAEWEVEEPDVSTRLTGSIDQSTYLELYLLKKCRYRDEEVRKVTAQFSSLLATKPDRLKATSAQSILDYCIHKFEQFRGVCKTGEASISNSRSVTKWIRSDNLFVTFVKKSPAGSSSSLIPEALKALAAWNPSPNRLVLSKFRSALSSQASLADDYALKNEKTHAFWLREMLTAGEFERASTIQNSVHRYGERLLDSVIPEVTKFALKVLSQYEANEDKHAIVHQFFGIDLNDGPSLEKAKMGHNIYCCSKAPTGSYLTTGHVLFWQDFYWVCLSPACDLVPFRNSKSPEDAVKFKAIKLYRPKNADAALADKSGSTIFLEIDGAENWFSFHKNTDPGASPDWIEALALKQGQISSNILKVCVGEWKSSDPANEAAFSFQSTFFDAKVVGQLRYEYALNLLHKLGFNLSRIGLDLK